MHIAIVEIPKGSRVKYEYDPLNRLVVDRIISTPMNYPYNYGFIEHTLSEDGDPLDVVIYCEYSIYPGSRVSIRTIGALYMKDNNEEDPKIISVIAGEPYKHINTLDDIPKEQLRDLEYFFKHYKDLDKKKVDSVEYRDKEYADNCIEESINTFNSSHLK